MCAANADAIALIAICSHHLWPINMLNSTMYVYLLYYYYFNNSFFLIYKYCSLINLFKVKQHEEEVEEKNKCELRNC